MLAVLLAPLIILNTFFVVECLVGLTRDRKAMAPSSPEAIRTVVVIPAHDEREVIEGTITSLREQLPPGHGVLVIADNCSDDTAEIARRYNVDVGERHDPERKGKGYALAFARDLLASNPPQIVIIVDADCRIDQASLRVLAGTAAASNRPVQSENLLMPDLGAEPMVQVSNFAFMVKNRIRQSGLFRLSGSVHLTGTGMAFPWAIYRDAPLATASIVEDLKLGIDLMRQDRGPLFAPGAQVWSSASSARGTLTQRTRWEGGYIGVSARVVLPLLREAIRLRRLPLLFLAMNLAVPPLTLLVFLNLLFFSACGGLTWFLAGDAWPVISHGLSIVLLAAVLLAIWLREGGEFLSAPAARRIPLYLWWKIPVYARMLRRSQRSWLRTGREAS
jgi:cellulose synthase/poly-beta-1,6-N-acetylglucosamine synthase-like glycosyltransferase